MEQDTRQLHFDFNQLEPVKQQVKLGPFKPEADTKPQPAISKAHGGSKRRK